MTFIADANVPDPVVRALQAIRFDIRRLDDVAAGEVSDRAVAHSVLASGGILITLDLGRASSAYTSELIENGLTVVSLRWNASTPLDWQQMVDAILRKADSWLQAAGGGPALINVSHAGGSRPRSGPTLTGRLADLPPAENLATQMSLPFDSQ